MEEQDYEDIDEVIGELVDSGLVIEHVDEKTGDVRYEVSERAKKEAPEFWAAHVMDLRKTLYELFAKDMITINFSMDGPMMDTVALTDLAFDKQAVDALDHYLRDYLNVLINVLAEKNVD